MHMQYKVDPDDALRLPSFAALYALASFVALLTLCDLGLWWLGFDSWRAPLGINLSLIAAVVGGARIVYGALVALFEGNVGADLALAIALVASIVLGEYFVAAEVVLIALVGESLEALTFSRTHREIRRLLELRPRRVRVRRGSQEVEIAAEDVVVGDLVLVRPGERVPVDGLIVAGASSIDQSTLTGEGVPVDRAVGDKVYTGTLNQLGAIEVRTERVGADTTLGQIIQLVAESQAHKAPIERTADRFARYFLPAVLACAAATFVATNWSNLWMTEGVALARWTWMPTLAVLVVACPCSLILATPAAVLAALAVLARRGVLIKGGLALERLAAVRRMAFDKTGTLTDGKLQVGDVVALGAQGGEIAEARVLAVAAAAEQSSEHPIATAIVSAARARGLHLPPIEAFQALPGVGVSARMWDDSEAGYGSTGATILVGNRRLMADRGVELTGELDKTLARLDAAGQSSLVVAVDGLLAGVIGVRDQVRSEAATIIRELRSLGIEEIVLLTGDRRPAAARVAAAVGIDRFEAELLPADKAAWLARWRSEPSRTSELEVATRGASNPKSKIQNPKSQGRAPVRVAMVGDGVNDAPALAMADVGLALGGVGSDIAAEAGDLVLMGQPLAPLPGLLRLARETVRVITQNIVVFAFIVNFLGIALTAWIMPSWSEAWMRRSPVAAALFHQIGSVLVLLNSMRLLWFDVWDRSFLGRLERHAAEAASPVFVVGRGLASLVASCWRARRRIALAAACVALAAYLALGTVIIRLDEVGVQRRFGRFEGLLAPGLHLCLPPPWDVVTREKPALVRTIEVGIRSVDTGSDGGPIEWNSPHSAGRFTRLADEAVLLTGDQSLVELGVAIQYRIADLKAYVFSVADPASVLGMLAEGTTREVIAEYPLVAGGGSRDDEILTTARAAIEEKIAQRLSDRAAVWGLGVEILDRGVCLADVHPPLDVVGAFRDVSSAFKERGRLVNEADADYRINVIEAGGHAAWQALSQTQDGLSESLWHTIEHDLEGQAAADVLAARASAVSRENLATGNAQSFLLAQRAQATQPPLTRWRKYADTLSAVLAGKQKLILDAAAGGRRHLLLGKPELGPLEPWMYQPLPASDEEFEPGE